MRIKDYHQKLNTILSELESELELIINGESTQKVLLPDTINSSIEKLKSIRTQAIQLEHEKLSGIEISNRWSLSAGRISQIKKKK